MEPSKVLSRNEIEVNRRTVLPVREGSATVFTHDDLVSYIRSVSARAVR